MRPEEIAKVIERHVRVSVAYDGPSIVNIDDASEEIAAAFAGTVDKAEAWDVCAGKNAALATARNDALEEAAKWHDEQAEVAEELDIAKVASFHREAAFEIRALKSETPS